MKPLACFDCDISYSEMGVDLVLPDQQWKLIFPEESGLLCANCICERAAKLDGSAILAWVDNLNSAKAGELRCSLELQRPMPVGSKGERSMLPPVTR